MSFCVPAPETVHPKVKITLTASKEDLQALAQYLNIKGENQTEFKAKNLETSDINELMLDTAQQILKGISE